MNTVKNEPVWLAALILIGVTCAAHYGFRLNVDEIVGLNVLATLALAYATRANTVPFGKFLALAYPQNVGTSTAQPSLLAALEAAVAALTPPVPAAPTSAAAPAQTFVDEAILPLDAATAPTAQPAPAAAAAAPMVGL